ncbi:MAG: hypothetical protein WCY25_01740 [Moheibacter sp.]
MTQKPIPIFIIGAARTGTTNLCNRLSELNNVTGVTSIYHYGNCESKILRNQLYWGNLSKFNNFLKFAGHIQYSDYFISAHGDIEKLLKSQPKDYFNFYLDLMDSYAIGDQKLYWVTKLDDLFFVYPKFLKEFLEILTKRYGEGGFRVITIKRELNSSILSYLYMEGKFAKIRKINIGRLFAIFLQTLRFKFIYQNAKKYFSSSNWIKFEEYIKDSDEVLSKLNLTCKEDTEPSQEKFMINSSFTTKKNKKLRRIDLLTIKFASLLYILKVGGVILNFYNRFHKINNPLYYRQFMHIHQPDMLRKDLEKREAFDLIEKLNLS